MARKNEAFEILRDLLENMEAPRSTKASLPWSKGWRLVRRKQEADAARAVERFKAGKPWRP